MDFLIGCKYLFNLNLSNSCLDYPLDDESKMTGSAMSTIKTASATLSCTAQARPAISTLTSVPHLAVESVLRNFHRNFHYIDVSVITQWERMKQHR